MKFGTRHMPFVLDREKAVDASAFYVEKTLNILRVAQDFEGVAIVAFQQESRL